MPDIAKQLKRIEKVLGVDCPITPAIVPLAKKPAEA